MEIEEMIWEDHILYQISGRIDSNTSNELRDRILNGFQKCRRIVLDFAGVAYISSGGLRALLLGAKAADAKKGSLRLVHVGREVRDVFELTGFDSLLNLSEE